MLKRTIYAGILMGFMILFYSYAESTAICAVQENAEAEQVHKSVMQEPAQEWEDTDIIGNQYSCKKVADGYEVKLFDKGNKEVYSFVYPKIPWISEITDNILEIGISTGIATSYVFYFDKDNSKMSDVYCDPILLGNKYIAYMENEKELVLIDIFAEGILNKKMEREFMRLFPEYISAIYNIEMLDDEKILLEYYAGEDYAIVSEIIGIAEDNKLLEAADYGFCDSDYVYRMSAVNLYSDEYLEPVIEEGLLHQGRVMLDFRQGLLSSGDAALSADMLGKLIIDALEDQDAGSERYGQLEENWKANRYYDCYYMGVNEEDGYAGFLYYFYPDFDEMKTEIAKAVVVRCNVDIDEGKPVNTETRIFPITKAGYHTAREWLPAAWDDCMVNSSMDAMGEQFWEDLKAGDYGNGWNLKKGYDGYYFNNSGQTGTIHYKYYFYWEKAGEGKDKVLALDTWISEEEMVDVKKNWFMTDKSMEEAGAPADGGTEGKEKIDIAPFLVYDWTSGDVLMWEHSIEPEDSGHGWEFSIADIDFDGSQEMLISFAANHCGQNSLYIYGQENGEIFSYADVLAVFNKYIFSYIDYKEISPYLDIDLLAAYENEEGEYRYLSLDYSLFGGGAGTVALYETELTENAGQTKLMEIIYCFLDEEKEMYFMGERVYESGRLRDMLAEHMDGYTEVQIEYKTAKKTFPRDIVAMDETDKKRELNELYDSLEALAADE